MLVPFTLFHTAEGKTGHTVYVNPAQVTRVQPVHTKPEKTLIYFSKDDSIVVNEDPATVASRL